MTTSTAGEREQRRAALLPADISYPDLPVSAVREELTAAIRDNQVVVVAGETGSGKTTQLPKMCLELGRGVRGMIAHTQPRRIAARAVAERVAEELGVELGSTVGYTVRFADRAGPDTLLRVMTDGVPLAEISSDPMLARYDTVIVDEAHERSLTIDFLLGYLKQLLPRRPDLKVVITSATIDTERFAAHFGDAPVVTVTGRTYPVQLRYRPVVDPDDPATDDRDQTQAVCDAVGELAGEGPGDVLVFLSGEREIRDTAEALRGLVSRDTEVLPLYGRLSAEEQHRVFAPHTGRRVVLATNVAETSLTVPGIRYVVDAGTARISRWSRRTKVQRLPIEPVSRASADQRAGRCGRVADGICIRLYDEADYESRPEYAEPEILRTDLAAIVLRMTALGLGDVAAFPFLDPPDRRDVRSALDLLAELGALEPGRPGDVPRLTRVGRHLARLPVDPRLARMLLAADADGCLAEMLVIVAGLSIQDPRERPADAQQAAVDAHRRFAVDGSDFLAYLRLWEYLRDRQEALSSSAFRRMCRAEYLHYLRIREWQDLHAQLRRATRDLGARPNASPAAEEAVHRAVLAGLLSHVGLRDPATGDYAGARGTRFQLSPGSVLARRGPRWVVAAELVETSRLWGRVAARVQPEWVERLAGHLVQRSYSEPHWDAGRGAVMASERVTLYGLPLVAARPVTYSRVDPALRRELFMQHALVEGDWRTFHAFASHNRSLLTEVGELEERVRRHDLRVRDTVLYDFFDTRIPADVVSARSFDSWWKRERHRHLDLLDLPRSLLVDAGAEERVRRDFPGALPAGGGELPLAYRFSPGADDDGVTVRVPLGVLNRLRPGEVDAAVPGLREELVTALLRSLPKDLRRRLGPAPDLARTVASRLAPGTPLLDALEHELRRETGVGVPRDAWHPERLPDHLRLRYEVRDDRGAVVGADRDLAGLQRRLAREVQAALARAAGGLEREGLRTWPGATLPRSIQRRSGDTVVVAYPALVDCGDSVAVRALASEAEQHAAMALGTRRLLQLAVANPVRGLASRLGDRRVLGLARSPYPSVAALLADCASAAVDGIVSRLGGPEWDAEGFERLREAVRAELPDAAYRVAQTAEQVLAAAAAVERTLAELRTPATAGAATEVRAQLAALLYPGFVSATGEARLPDLARYLGAAQRRLDKARLDPARDRVLAGRVRAVEEEYARLARRLPADGPARDGLAAVRWMVEELRVSLFAQELRTRQPVSEARIFRALDLLAA